MSSLTEFIWTTIYCVGFLFILFTYIGFPILLKIFDIIINSFRHFRCVYEFAELPDIQIIISCYNEADIIMKTINDKLW